jgi:hypothetical protein
MKLFKCQYACWFRRLGYKQTDFVIRSNMERGSRMKVGNVTRLRSAPGRSCDMMCESTAQESHVSQLSRARRVEAWGVHTAALLRVHDGLVFFGNVIAAGLVHRGSSAACRINRHKLATFSSRVLDWCRKGKVRTRQRSSSAVNARQMRHDGRGGCRESSKGRVRATEAAGRA